MAHTFARFGAALALMVAALVPSTASAQSACTAMWGLYNVTGGTGRLAYFNNSAGVAGKWTTTTLVVTGNAASGPNALAGDNDNLNPRLYFFDRTSTTIAINPNNLTTSTVGTLSAPPPAGNSNIIGATIDASGNLIYLAGGGAAGTPYWLGIINKTGPTTSVRWQTMTYAGGAIPVSGGSGDMFLDAGGQVWVMTNTNPVALYPVTLTIAAGSITSAIAGTSVTYAAGAVTVAGAGVNPTNNQPFFGGITAANFLFSFNSGVADSQAVVDTTGPQGVSDIGNCPNAPLRPTINKTISPDYRAAAGVTTTLTITINNPNWASIFLPVAFSDVFPTGMAIASVPNLVTSTGCIGVISATAGSNSVTFQADGRIPGGPSGSGCAFSLSVIGITSTTALTNTVPSDSLTTTAGTNASGVTATFKVGTDFSAQKLQATSTGVLTAASVTFGASQPVLYQLNIVNSAVGGTGSATFTDTLPTQITPVLSVTAVHSGGGSCTTASAVVGGRTIITGTVTNALAGSTCTVTVQGRATSTLVASTAIVNTLTLAPLPGTSDTDSSNNRATVTAGVTPGTVLTITKTNVITTLLAGQTTSYTVTVSNLGPAAATGAIVTDPVAPGLACTAITCNVAGGAVCPGGLTTTTFSTGAVIGTFPAASTLTFTLRCNVTATGR